MIILSVSQLHEFVRERMPHLDSECQVVEVADFIWREGHSLGFKSGDDWRPLVATMPADMNCYYEVIQGSE